MQSNQFNPVSTKLEDLAKVVVNDLAIMERNAQDSTPIPNQVQDLNS